MRGFVYRHWGTISILVILLFSAYLRLWNIAGYMTFLGDEGRDVLVVKRMIVDHDITFLGPTASVGGFFLGPIYYYFMAPFLWLWNLNPVGPAIMVALFGIATVYMVYVVGRDFYNKKVGIIAAALYTVSPLVIAHSRSSWNPNLVPFFSLLLIYSLWKYSQTKSIHWLYIVGLSLGVGIQLHYLFGFLIIITAVYLVLIKAYKQIKNVLVVGGSFLALLVPFFGFELNNNFMNTRTLFGYVFQEGDVGINITGSWQTLMDVMFRLYARLIFLFPSVDQLSLYNNGVLIIWKVGIWLCIFFSVRLVVIDFIQRRDGVSRIMLTWLIFGVGLFMFYQDKIYDYYFVIMFALPFLLLANLIVVLMDKAKFKWIIFIVVSLLVLANWTRRPFMYLPNRQLNQVKEISEFVFDKAGGSSFNFALITGSNSDHAYRYFFEIWENTPVVIENKDNDPGRATVTQQLFVVCESLPCEPLGHDLWEIAGFGKADIENSWDVSVVKVYKLIPFHE